MSGKKIHFMGVGGVGMAGLAVLLKAEGHLVTGCDLHATPRTRWLESQGIPVATGHHPDHLADVDEVIVTPAVHRDNPEYLAALAQGVRVRYRGEVLAELVSARNSIAVCGSHGKTTTSTFIARLLLALGERVSWAIGGETGDFPVAGVDQVIKQSNNPKQSNNQTIPNNPKQSNNPVLVVEADESDGTLALYHATTLVVTNCEYDHPDHFKTPADYFACYETAKRQAKEVIESEKLPSLEVEKLPSLEVEKLPCSRIEESRGCGILPQQVQPLYELLQSLPAHNQKNARAAIEVALRRSHSLAAIAKALPPIVAELPDRRFQQIWPLPPPSTGDAAPRRVAAPTGDAAPRRVAPPRPETRRLAALPPPDPLGTVPEESNNPNNQTIITDYAHHPTEMKCAVSMARARCPGTLRVLFQPHRYSRTKALLNDFPAAFEGADEVVLCPTYAAFEDPVEGGDIADLYRVCRAASMGTVPEESASMGTDPAASMGTVPAASMGTDPEASLGTVPEESNNPNNSNNQTIFYLARSCAEAWEHARNSMQPGDLTLLLGAGDIINLVPIIQRDLSTNATPPRRAAPTPGDAAPRRVAPPAPGDAAPRRVAPPAPGDAAPRRVAPPAPLGTVPEESNNPNNQTIILLGAGSNTWKSDLNLSVRYVKTAGPAGRPGAELVAAHPTLLPWMAGIPGAVGGWIKMNAGAFGHSISEVLEAVKVDGRWIPAADCGFGYRTSNIKGEIQDYRLIDAAGAPRLPGKERRPGDAAPRRVPLGTGPEESLDPAYYLAKRKRFPAGTKGSVFKNPPGDFAGRLLEAVGAKELRVGGAYVWSEHANVIVSGEGSVPSDFLALARLMRERVRLRLGITLEPEVQGLIF